MPTAVFFLLATLGLGTYVALFARRVGREVKRLRETFSTREALATAEGILVHNECVTEADHLWQLGRKYGPKLAQAPLLLAAAGLLAQAGNLRNFGVALAISVTIVAGAVVWVYTTGVFRRIERELKGIREEIRLVSRPSRRHEFRRERDAGPNRGSSGGPVDS